MYFAKRDCGSFTPKRSSIAFFVHRPFITAAAAQACDALEVMHVRTDWLDGEKGVVVSSETSSSAAAA